MKIHCYSNNKICEFFRISEPARVLKDKYDITYSDEIDIEYSLDRSGKLIANPICDSDVILISRPATNEIVETILKFQKQGKKVIVDLDDDLLGFDYSHPMKALYENKVINGKFTKEACKIADLVIVTTKALADRYAKHGRFLIIPNFVPHPITEIEKSGNGRTIGWSGIAHMHTADMDATYGGVQQAMDSSGWEFLKIGDGADIVKKHFGLRDMPKETGELSVENYHKALAKLDIGIVPLKINNFNEAKSYLKGLQYAALGIPFIASNTRPYIDLYDNGIGIVAINKGRSWKSALLRLMKNEDLKFAVGIEYREIVRENYTYEKNAWRWEQAFEEVTK